MQQQVDAGQRKYTTAETILKQITQERDSAVSQLGVAFVTIEQLKAENENLKDENNEFRTRTKKLGNAHLDEVQEPTDKENRSQHQLDPGFQSVETLRQKTRSEKNGAKHPTANASRAQEHADSGIRRPRVPVHNDANTIFDLSARHDAENLYSNNRKAVLPNRDFHDSEDSSDDALESNRKGKSTAQPFRLSENTQDGQAGQDLTYLSFLDVRPLFQHTFYVNTN